MENDQKTGGVQRKGDREDPSAATFGEEWSAKRERIRRASPYGWMKNWDRLQPQRLTMQSAASAHRARSPPQRRPRHAHRLWLHAVQFSGKHGVRGRAVQADAGVCRRSRGSPERAI